MYEVLGYGSYVIGEMRVDGELQFYSSLDLHLFEPFMGHYLSIHRSKLKVDMVGMINAWIAKLRELLEIWMKMHEIVVDYRQQSHL